jgi:transposase
VLRLKAGAFNVYDEKGEKLEIADKIKEMPEGTYKELNLQCKISGKLHPIRLCVYRKTEKESGGSERQTKKSNKGKMRGKVSETQKFYGKFIIVATSLNETSEKILALYRQRWQIELLFKRLKSIFCLDEMPAKKEDSVKAWFYGKLLLAAVCEALDNMGRFSP